MISFIKGKIIDLDFTNTTILTSCGLGYDVGINELTYSKMTLEGDISMYIHHHITENNQTLFGFIEKEEKEIFKELIKISGVGGKVAMQILSLGLERLVLAITGEDNKTIESVKGIGKKMAEKIILELKDKDFGISIKNKETISKANIISADLHSSIKSTLTNMGYNAGDIDRILSNLPEEMDNAGAIIPYVIKNLS